MTSSMECREDLKVLEKNGYQMTVAVRAFAKGEGVFLVKGEGVDHPTPYTIQVTKDRHVLTLHGKYVNHSCDPNCYFDLDQVIFRALRPIRAGEEITFDYNTTEYEMSRPFLCHCGADNCIKSIRGYKYLEEAHRRRLAPWTPDYLKSMYKMRDARVPED